MLLSECKRSIQTELMAAGIEPAVLLTRLVMEDTLHIAPMMLAVTFDRELTEEEETVLRERTERLLTGEPAAYVLGTAPFLDLTLSVDPSVLIPRPETEELALWVIDTVQQKPMPKVLDLCTGSGALALAVKHRVPQAEVTASDLSPDALRTAQNNAGQLGLEISFVQSDLLDSVNGIFDCIVSNPPYIPTAECGELDRNVRDFEPHMALDGGIDGLDFYRRIVADAPRHLNDGGELFLEVGYDQAEQVAPLLEENGFRAEIRNDMQGVPRMIRAEKETKR